MRLQVDLLPVRILAFAISVASVNGYILGRLITINNAPAFLSETPNTNEAVWTRGLAVASSTPERTESIVQAASPYSLQKEPLRTKTKKGLNDLASLKASKNASLRKFNGSGSRNCFFTPIQCMIQHDMSKYKKLVDNSVLNYGIARRSKFIYPVED